MKVGIFYFSKNAGKDRQEVTMSDGSKAYVRGVAVRVHSARPLEAALNAAVPQDDESLMNTHELSK